MNSTEQMKAFVALDMLQAYDSNKTPLIAAGPLVKQPHTLPFRVVIANKGHQIVVWNEVLMDENIVCIEDRRSTFNAGEYFGPDELDKAQESFARRLKQTADFQVSMYRLVEAA